MIETKNLSEITIEEIKEESGKYHYKNLIIETNRILKCNGNTITIKDDILIVIGRLLNNSFMIRFVGENLKINPQIKYVIWNGSETFTDTSQNVLKSLLDENTNIRFIFITNDFNKIKQNITTKCLLIEE